MLALGATGVHAVTPEEIVKVQRSYTGAFLAPVLGAKGGGAEADGGAE
jgi:hypothetical protein